MKDVPRTIHHGITTHAKQLGVHRIHLWLVLTGRRQSRSLIKRYRALKKEPAKVKCAICGRTQAVAESERRAG